VAIEVGVGGELVVQPEAASRSRTSAGRSSIS
jgi:hypothetical protein